MAQQVHKLFLARCDRFGEPKMVCASDCEQCRQGSVIDRRTRVICGGETKFFLTPCFNDLRAAATVIDCENCPLGEIGDDRLRVFCSAFS
jgi:hypothetical protein